MPYVCCKTTRVSSVLIKGSANLLSFLTTRYVIPASAYINLARFSNYYYGVYFESTSLTVVRHHV